MKFIVRLFSALFVLFSLSILQFAIADSEKGIPRNPFLTLYEQKHGFSKEARQVIQPYLYLQGTFVWPDKKIALINGQVVREGEAIENKKVISISEEEVVLADNLGTMLVLRLPSPDGGIKESEK